MNRRTILKSFILAPLLYSNAYSSTTKESKPKFKISMYGDLDDDLIILKSTLKVLFFTMEKCIQ